jgi:cytochrome b561
MHEGATDGASARALLDTHRSLGMLVWLVTVARLAWRLTGAYLPPFPASMSRLQRAAAKLNEYALYAFLLLQPITGMAQTIYRGRRFELFFIRIEPLAPRDRDLVSFTHDIHYVSALILLALIGLHACATLFHHFILRDGVLGAMAPMLARKNPRP